MQRVQVPMGKRRQTHTSSQNRNADENASRREASSRTRVTGTKGSEERQRWQARVCGGWRGGVRLTHCHTINSNGKILAGTRNRTSQERIFLINISNTSAVSVSYVVWYKNSPTKAAALNSYGAPNSYTLVYQERPPHNKPT